MAEPITTLSSEERAYLHRLFSAAAAQDDGQQDYIELSAPEFGRELLLRALVQMRSELVATDGRYVLRFQLEVVDDGPGSVQRLRLSVPVVTDSQGVERSARVCPPEGEVVLLDETGRLQAPRIDNLSRSGVALSQTAGAALEPGSRVRGLYLALPDTGGFHASARVVRVEQGGQRVALAFEDVPDSARLALQRYVFDRYACAG